MTPIIKINIENACIELETIGSKVLSENTNETINVTDMAMEVISEHSSGSFADDVTALQQFDKIFEITKCDNNDEEISSIVLIQKHIEYDFNKEILYGFYELSYASNDEIFKKFSKLAKHFNKEVDYLKKV